uniref:Nucleoside 2-deoxyribosyltransferase n=1 Tax=Rhabditophanes sp. KR3021 TaxID=114890 RepID=A0AC35UHD5_9BILA
MCVAVDAASANHPKYVFCSSDWVSRAKVLNKVVVNENLDPDFFAGQPHVRYAIGHIQAYRTPLFLNATDLPNIAFTYESMETCGIPILEIGTEYLLSGNHIASEPAYLTINACNQISSEVYGIGSVPQIYQDLSLTQKLKLELKEYEVC